MENYSFDYPIDHGQQDQQPSISYVQPKTEPSTSTYLDYANLTSERSSSSMVAEIPPEFDWTVPPPSSEYQPQSGSHARTPHEVSLHFCSPFGTTRGVLLFVSVDEPEL